MADVAQQNASEAHAGETRRDFLLLTAGAIGGVGVAAAIWPFVDTLNPARDTLALPTTPRRRSRLRKTSTSRNYAIRRGIPTASRSRNGWLSSASVPISAASHSARRPVTTAVNTAVGSAPVTARSTTP